MSVFGRPRSRPAVLALVAVLAFVLVATAVVTWRVWQEDDGFCASVRGLPDVTASLGPTGTPSSGLASSAQRLDHIADVAPDPDTATAATTLASAQRAVADALRSGSTSAQAVSAIAAAATPQVAAARSQLQSAFASSCR